VPVPIVAMLKPQFWGPWGSILAPLGSTLASFWSSWASLGPPGELFGDKVDFRGIFPLESSSILEAFLAPEASKVAKKRKKTVSEKHCRKHVLPKPSRNGQKGDPYCKNHMFWEVGHPPFGWLLASFWLPFGVTLGHFLQKVVIRELKKAHTKNASKIDAKRGCE